MLSENESPVGSSGDDGAFARPPLRHDLVVSIVADDDFNVQRLSAATAAAVRRLGGPPDAAGLHVLGYAHLRWVIVDSALVSNVAVGLVRLVRCAAVHLWLRTGWTKKLSQDPGSTL